jgi:hypothetical protein
MSTGDVLGLVALLIAVVFGISWMFQQQGEARLQSLKALRREVRQLVRSLELAVEDLSAAQSLSAATIECLVRALDVVVVCVESNGGVMAELLESVTGDPFPGYARAHRDLVDELRQAVAELRVLSPDGERRMSAAKALAFGRGNFSALEAVQTAMELYPDDEQLQTFGVELRSHLLRP